MKTSIQLILLFILTQVLFLSTVAQEEQKPELIVQLGHYQGAAYGIMDLSFSRDNKYAVTAGSECEVIFWEVATGRELQKLDLSRINPYNSCPVNSVAFSPDNNFVLIGGGRVALLWDIENKRVTQKFEKHKDAIYYVAYSSDGRFVATGAGRITHLWDVNSGKEIAQLKQDSSIYNLTFSPNSKLLLTGSYDGKAYLWNVEKAQLIRNFKVAKVTEFPETEQTPTAVAFSSNGELILAGVESSAKVWNSESGLEIKEFKFSGSVSWVAFSPDGNSILISSNYTKDGGAYLFDINTGKELKKFGAGTRFAAFSPDNKFIATSAVTENLIKTDPNWYGKRGDNNAILWDVSSGEFVRSLEGQSDLVSNVAVSQNGRFIFASSIDKASGMWDISESQLKWNFHKKSVDFPQLMPSPKNIINNDSPTKFVSSAVFSSNGTILVAEDEDAVLRSVEDGRVLQVFQGHQAPIRSVALSADGRFALTGSGGGGLDWNGNGVKSFTTGDGAIRMWNVATGAEMRRFGDNRTGEWAESINSIMFSPDNLYVLAAYGQDAFLWEKSTGRLLHRFGKMYGHTRSGESQERKYVADYGKVTSAVFTPNEQFIVTGYSNGTAHLWNVKTGKEILTYNGHNNLTSVAISHDGNKVLTSNNSETYLWETITGKRLQSFDGGGSSVAFSGDNRFILTAGIDSTIRLWSVSTGKVLCRLIIFRDGNWLVVNSEGRFDTNKSLDQIEGLHWSFPNESLRAFPLEIFMRQYYEPGLLHRVLNGEQFKTLPSIAEINRVQPKVLIKNVQQVKDSADLVDVTVDVESVTEDVSVSAADRAKKEKKTSGVFDLRLFRDEQFVGVSAPQEKLEKFIKDAPRLVEETRLSGKLIDTPEDRAWREANDVFALTAENVRKISANKIEYTFRNVRLPNDGRESVEFKAYAFNADKVKSATTEPLKFSIPKTVSAEKKKGKAILVSIGVNASENPAYDLRYAANDAREMQKIVGGNLLKEKGAKYADVIQIPLVSDYKTEQFPAVNAAQKEIIRGVFALLSGRNYKDVLAGLEKINPKLAEEFQKIPNIEKLGRIEPEDTLIISFSGHGYADNAGIFYLLPFDIGANTSKLTTENLNKMISSDELSLWMQDITAAEMIMIIDACHSSAAVQGDGFKPGPMASRGLGQLAYDKDMKILSATQANNVALELGSLQQGLLSYALLQDGIIKSLADSDKNKQMLSTEWLLYAESRVPGLYTEVLDGKRGVFINGKNIKPEEIRSGVYNLDGNQKSNLNLQQPSLFDFKRRKTENLLFNLP